MIKQNQLEDTKILLNYFIYAILIDELFKHIFLIIGYGRLIWGKEKEIKMKWILNEETFCIKIRQFQYDLWAYFVTVNSKIKNLWNSMHIQNIWISDLIYT